MLQTLASRSEGGEAREGIASDAQGRAGEAVAFGVGESPDVAHCIRAGASKADKHESTTYVCTALYENHGQDSRLTGPLDISPTVAAKFGTGGNNTPLVSCYDHKDLGRRSAEFVEQAPTLKSRMGTGGCNVPLVEHYRKSRRAQSVDDCETWVPDDVTNTVNCFDVGDVRAVDIVMAHGQANAEIVSDGCPTLNCNHEQPILFNSRMNVRRLTPLECERLQGFPDGWTDISGVSDSARYKALGNSLAIPTAEYVIEGIAIEIAKGVNP